MAGKFERRMPGDFRFRLEAGNGQVESAGTNAPDAVLDDQTD